MRPGKHIPCHVCKGRGKEVFTEHDWGGPLQYIYGTEFCTVYTCKKCGLEVFRTKDKYNLSLKHTY